MRDLLTIAVSDNGEEIYVYDQEGLTMIRSVGDPDTVGEYVKGVIQEVAEGE
jgi:hypothetical protein